jgi:hypothetical protein
MSSQKKWMTATAEQMNWDVLTDEVLEAATKTAHKVAGQYGVDADDLAQEAYAWSAHNPGAAEALQDAADLRLYVYRLRQKLSQYAQTEANKQCDSLEALQARQLRNEH